MRQFLRSRTGIILAGFSGVAILGMLSACGTLGAHYDIQDDTASTPALNASGFRTAAILVDSQPSGAMIRMNGIRIGPGPAIAHPAIDLNGNLLTDLVLMADYSTFAFARNSTERVLAHYRGGDRPPRKVTLARSADGGVLSLGGGIPE